MHAYVLAKLSYRRAYICWPAMQHKSFRGPGHASGVLLLRVLPLQSLQLLRLPLRSRRLLLQAKLGLWSTSISRRSQTW